MLWRINNITSLSGYQFHTGWWTQWFVHMALNVVKKVCTIIEIDPYWYISDNTIHYDTQGRMYDSNIQAPSDLRRRDVIYTKYA